MNQKHKLIDKSVVEIEGIQVRRSGQDVLLSVHVFARGWRRVATLRALDVGVNVTAETIRQSPLDVARLETT